MQGHFVGGNPRSLLGKEMRMLCIYVSCIYVLYGWPKGDSMDVTAYLPSTHLFYLVEA